MVAQVDLRILKSILFRGRVAFKYHLFKEAKNNVLNRNIVFYFVLLIILIYLLYFSKDVGLSIP